VPNIFAIRVLLQIHDSIAFRAQYLSLRVNPTKIGDRIRLQILGLGFSLHRTNDPIRFHGSASSPIGGGVTGISKAIGVNNDFMSHPPRA
jgi:hypothetical protein